MPACAGMTPMVTWPEMAYGASLRFARDVIPAEGPGLVRGLDPGIVAGIHVLIGSGTPSSAMR